MTDLRGVERSSLVGLAVTLWILLPFLALGGYLWFAFQGLNFVGCADDCLTDLLRPAFAVLPWALLLSIVIAIALSIFLGRSGRRTVWGPVVGVSLVALTLAAMQVVSQIGFAPMYERNERAAAGPQPATSPTPLAAPVGAWGTNDPGAAQLVVLSGGLLSGTDGCDTFTGSWSSAPAGTVRIEKELTSANDCAGIDTWLRRADSVAVQDGYLVGFDDGAVIGGLPAMAP